MNDVTIKDIADKAGVSISTVSRVLNGNYPVSASARARVEKAIEDMDYLPNAIARSLRSSVAGDAKGKEDMALGQYIAGMGFSNVGLGIAHSMAHTLGAVYDTPHGVACAMMLPIVMEFNQEATGEKYREIARAMGVKNVDSMSQSEYRKAAIDAV